MTYGSFLYPPQIHFEQEDPLNLDEENYMIEGTQGSVGICDYVWLTTDC